MDRERRAEMELEDIIKFQLKRVNPFQGLVVDTDIWRDAHEYHRDQQRLHMLAFHSVGIVAGLEVAANKTPDLSVNIRPGIAVDPEGNIIIVSKEQRYSIQTREKGTIYLIIQFREVPTEPYQPPDGGQPTRILEAYRIQEREKLPREPYLELARIDFDPADEAIREAKNPTQPGKNEINLNSRQQATPASMPKLEKPAPQDKVIAPAKDTKSQPIETIAVGHAVLGEASQDLHISGLQNLMREINRQDRFEVKLEGNISLNKKISRCAMIYLTGTGHFELTAEQQSALGNFLESGGVILGEGCAEGQPEAASKGAKEFGLAFNQLASQLNCKLEVVQRDHPLLSTFHVFSEVPQGAEPAMLLEGGHMIYSAGDYGCAWQGGHQAQPLSRDIIRGSFEIGTNIVTYARLIFSSGH
jgi:hypothetical protein